MITISVKFRAPEKFVIPAGEYTVFGLGQPLKVEYPPVFSYREDKEEIVLECEGKAVVSTQYASDIRLDEQRLIENECRRVEEITLRAVNHLIRWHRFYTKQFDMRELAFDQISPVIITLAYGDKEIVRPREYGSVSTITPVEFTSETWERFCADIQHSASPSVVDLLLLDAYAALSEYRYRECVMLAWAAIEYIFDPFIYHRLRTQYPYISENTLQNFERDLHFLNRVDFLLRWITGFSFRADISLDFWSKFVTSRNKRNDLIHHGSDANIDDAEEAIWIAETVILHIRRLESEP